MSDRIEIWRAESKHGPSAKMKVMQDMLAEIERLRADKTKWILRCGIADAENERLNGLVAMQKKDMKTAMDEMAKLQAVVDAAISWANTDQNDIDGCDKTDIELMDAVLEYEMSVAALIGESDES